MTARKALIVYGGWDGHTPKECASLIADSLTAEAFDVRVENNLDIFTDSSYMNSLNLIIPVWTMGRMSPEQTAGLNSAVKDHGVGLAGFHGGMGDAFRGNIEYEWMVGGIFVGHPFVGEYTISLTDPKSTVTEGLAKSFTYDSEQYYMLTDPGNNVLATTIYKYEDKDIEMPVVWTKNWGRGRIFYSALGHTAEELKKYPDILDMTIRGMVWVADGKI